MHIAYVSLRNTNSYDKIIAMNNKQELLLEKISTDIKTGQFKQALMTIEVNKESLFLANPLSTLELHFGILFELRSFTEARKALLYYKDMPYVSQAIEDELKALEIKLERRIEKMLETLEADEQALKNMLKSGDYNEVMRAFSIIRQAKLPLEDFDEEINICLKHDYGRNVIFGLLLNTHIYLGKREIDVCYYGQNRLIDTRDFFIPTEHVAFKEVIKELEKHNKNTTVYGFAKELAVFKSFEIFPETFTQSDAKTLAVYFVYQARLALQESFNHALFFKSHQISDENIKNIVKKYHLDMYQG